MYVQAKHLPGQETTVEVPLVELLRFLYKHT